MDESDAKEILAAREPTKLERFECLIEISRYSVRLLAVDYTAMNRVDECSRQIIADGIGRRDNPREARTSKGKRGRGARRSGYCLSEFSSVGRGFTLRHHKRIHGPDGGFWGPVLTSSWNHRCRYEAWPPNKD